MDRESFLDTLKQQFGEQITELYYEYEHGKKVDIDGLWSALDKLRTQAFKQGLGYTEFDSLVQSSLPSEVWDKKSYKKAA